MESSPESFQKEISDDKGSGEGLFPTGKMFGSITTAIRLGLESAKPTTQHF